MKTAKKPKNPRFEVYPSMRALHDWRWRLYARNGEIVGHGEGYTTEKDARRGVAAVKRAVLAIADAEALTATMDRITPAFLRADEPLARRVVKGRSR